MSCTAHGSIVSFPNSSLFLTISSKWLPIFYFASVIIYFSIPVASFPVTSPPPFSPSSLSGLSNLFFLNYLPHSHMRISLPKLTSLEPFLGCIVLPQLQSFVFLLPIDPPLPPTCVSDSVLNLVNIGLVYTLYTA